MNKISIPYLPLSFRRLRKFSVGKKSSLRACKLVNILVDLKLYQLKHIIRFIYETLHIQIGITQIILKKVMKPEALNALFL